MIVLSSGSTSRQHQLKVYKAGAMDLHWRGFVYVPGCRSGEESVASIAEELLRTGDIPFAKIRGSYSIIVVADDRTVAFADNAGLHTFYVHSDAVATNFLELVEHLRNSGHELAFDLEGLGQVYAIGRLLSRRTLLQGVTTLGRGEFAEIQQGRVMIHSKNVSEISTPRRNFTPTQFFNDLSFAVGPTKVSSALTGGYDSRLVFAFLHDQISLTPTLSGNRETNSDVKVGRVAAAAVGARLEFIETLEPVIDSAVIEQRFQQADGAPGCLSDSALRLQDYYQQLHDRGFGLHFTGDGGVLHKDWEWIQDFPRYHRRNTDLTKFYSQRLAFNFDQAGAGPSLGPPILEMRARTLTYLRRYVQSTNTRTYDMLYYHVNGRRSHLYNPESCGVVLYAPLMEPDFVAYSYALPRRQRAFNYSMRKLTTSRSVQLARVRTSYGMTASSEARFAAGDSLRQAIDYCRRLIRLVGRKVIGRTPLLEEATDWNTTPHLRELPQSEVAVQYCISLGCIASSETVNTLSRRHLEFAIETHKLGNLAGIVPAPDGDGATIRSNQTSDQLLEGHPDETA